MDQFWLPAMIWAVPETVGLIAATPATCSPIASLSSALSVVWVPAPPRMPLLAVLPDWIVRTFVPRFEIWEVTWAVDPWPSPTITMTATTPITMPRVVRTLRLLFARSASRAEGIQLLTRLSMPPPVIPGRLVGSFGCSASSARSAVGSTGQSFNASSADSGCSVTRSESTRPSRKTTTRLQNAAISGSWVTRTMVEPSRLSRWRIAMISTLVRLSRAPVGSSARIRLGRLTSALAMATRCCWPPDSSFGRWSARFAMLTESSAAIARSRRSWPETRA